MLRNSKFRSFTGVYACLATKITSQRVSGGTGGLLDTADRAGAGEPFGSAPVQRVALCLGGKTSGKYESWIAEAGRQQTCKTEERVTESKSNKLCRVQPEAR